MVPTTATSEEPYMDVEELARYIKSTPGSVRQLVHKRRLPFLKRGRRLLFSREAIDRHLAETAVEPSTTEVVR